MARKPHLPYPPRGPLCGAFEGLDWKLITALALVFLGPSRWRGSGERMLGGGGLGSLGGKVGKREV